MPLYVHPKDESASEVSSIIFNPSILSAHHFPLGLLTMNAGGLHSSLFILAFNRSHVSGSCTKTLVLLLTGMCMGSSTNHVVRFDGLALRLDGDGLCSYTLLTVSRGNSEGSEVKLHSGPCQDSANYNQVCMKAMEVIHGTHRLLLKDDVTVSYVCLWSRNLY